MGEVISIRQQNVKKGKGWDSAAYGWSEYILRDLGCRHLYRVGPRGRGFLLDTQSPEVEKIEHGEVKP
jgi:hypothetical protein